MSPCACVVVGRDGVVVVIGSAVVVGFRVVDVVVGSPESGPQAVIVSRARARLVPVLDKRRLRISHHTTASDEPEVVGAVYGCYYLRFGYRSWCEVVRRLRYE